MATAPAAAEGAEAAALQRPGRLTARAAAAAAGEPAGPRAAGRGSKWQPLPAASIRGSTAPGHCGKLRASTPPPRPIRGHLPPPPSASPLPTRALQPPWPVPKSGARARAETELCPEASGCRRGVQREGTRSRPGAGRWARTQTSGEESPGRETRREACRALVNTRKGWDRDGRGALPGQSALERQHPPSSQCPDARCRMPGAAFSPPPLAACAELEPGRSRPKREIFGGCRSVLGANPGENS